MISLTTIFLLVAAYLIGSIPSAALVCKFLNLPDPRESGSGNPGTTNVLRIGGKRAAALVLLADTLKGFIPVILASLFDVFGFMLTTILLVAVIGHMFPIFSKFQGGKGVATAFGGVVFLNPIVAMLTMLVWIIIIVTTRYVSLASLIAAIFAPVLILFTQASYFIPLAILSALVFWRHLPNIQRLKMRTENQVDLSQFK
jgi:glycerol-3-phosphate acyltransferase PlsY